MKHFVTNEDLVTRYSFRIKILAFLYFGFKDFFHFFIFILTPSRYLEKFEDGGCNISILHDDVDRNIDIKCFYD